MRTFASVESRLDHRRPAKLFLIQSSDEANPRKAEASTAPKVLRDHRMHWGIAIFWLAYFSAVIGGAFCLGWWLS